MLGLHKRVLPTRWTYAREKMCTRGEISDPMFLPASDHVWGLLRPILTNRNNNWEMDIWESPPGLSRRQGGHGQKNKQYPPAQVRTDSTTPDNNSTTLSKDSTGKPFYVIVVFCCFLEFCDKRLVVVFRAKCKMSDSSAGAAIQRLCCLSEGLSLALRGENLSSIYMRISKECLNACISVPMSGFSRLVLSPANRQTFIKTIISFQRNDGFDIDCRLGASSQQGGLLEG